MKTNYRRNIFKGITNRDDVLKKIKNLKILPWIAINFNILIQLLMFIFIIILIGRIKLKSDFGFQQMEINQSSRKKILGNLNANGESEKRDLKEKKKKKRKKKKVI